MMRILTITLLVLILSSCAGRRKVCGGPGGKRCVNVEKPVTLEVKNT